MKKFNSPCLYCGVISRGSVCRQCKAAIESKDPKEEIEINNMIMNGRN